MKKRIRVIVIGGKYLCYFRLNEYQEPVTAYTEDIFEALDINKYHMDAERIWHHCIIESHGLIEDYEVTAVRR